MSTHRGGAHRSPTTPWTLIRVNHLHHPGSQLVLLLRGGRFVERGRDSDGNDVRDSGGKTHPSGTEVTVDEAVLWGGSVDEVDTWERNRVMKMKDNLPTRSNYQQPKSSNRVTRWHPTTCHNFFPTESKSRNFP